MIAACAIAVLAGSAQAQQYHVIKALPVSGAGGWDYIACSPSNNNLYIAHATRVNIINRTTGAEVGEIPNTEGVHGIAFAPEFKKGFTSNGKANSVSVFDINTNAVTGQIKTGEKPDAIMYDAHTKLVFVCNGKSKDLTVIDPKNNEVVKTVALGGKPETAVSDGAGRIYVNIEDKNEVAVVNTKTYTVEHRWKTGTGEEPSGLAIDVKTKRLFAGCGNKKLVVLNAENGKVVKELPIGDGCDGTAFDPGTKTVFSSNGEGTLTVIKEKSANDFLVEANVPTRRGARTLALDEKTHTVYMPTADLGAPAPGEKRPSMIPGTFVVLVVGK